MLKNVKNLKNDFFLSSEKDKAEILFLAQGNTLVYSSTLTQNIS